MERCKTCKWWRHSPDNEWDRPEWGYCYLLSNDTDRDPKALALTNESIYGYLLSAPDFGCVQHEPRESGE